MDLKISAASRAEVGTSGEVSDESDALSGIEDSEVAAAGILLRWVS